MCVSAHLARASRREDVVGNLFAVMLDHVVVDTSTATQSCSATVKQHETHGAHQTVKMSATPQHTFHYLRASAVVDFVWDLQWEAR